MELSRRGFLASLLAAAAAPALDPERLLWVPGAKRIFVPPAQSGPCLLTWEEITRECLEVLQRHCFFSFDQAQETAREMGREFGGRIERGHTVMVRAPRPFVVRPFGYLETPLDPIVPVSLLGR